jgi:hypothetical protein
VTGKDRSGGSTGKDKELDALLSAADRDMLEAIRDNLDLDTGFAQILGDLTEITPTGRPTASPEAGPDGQAPSYCNALDPVCACEVSSAADKIPAAIGAKSPRKPLYHHRALITLALAVVAALNIGVLFSLSQNHAVVSAPSIASAAHPPCVPIAGESARDLYPLPPPKTRQRGVLADRVGASVSLRSAADSAGIGGDPVISYLRDSRNGPVLLLSGLPVGTATTFLSIGADQSCGNCSTVSHWNYPFLPSREQFSPGTTICIAGANGRVMLRTVPNQSSGQIDVIITSFPDCDFDLIPRRVAPAPGDPHPSARPGLFVQVCATKGTL